MTTELERRLEDALESLPTPTEAASESARVRTLAAVPRPCRRRRRIGLLALAGAGCAAALLLAVLAPWQGSGPLATERALAALGDQPVVHAIIESERPFATTVELSSGTERTEAQRVELFYDEERSKLKSRIMVGDRVLGEVLTTKQGTTTDEGPVPGAPSEPQLDPALAGFAGGFRRALESGEARVEGETTVDGRDAILLVFDLPRAGIEEVAVDAETYRPIRLRRQVGAAASDWWRVVTIETLARDGQQFTLPRQAATRPQPTGQTGGGSSISRAQATTVLGRRPVWPGASVDGLDVTKFLLERMTTEWSNGRKTQGRVLRLWYGSDGFSGTSRRWLTVAEGTERDDMMRFAIFDDGGIASGEVQLLGLDVSGGAEELWQGGMEIDGLYVLLESPDRDLVIAAAKAMRPMP